MAHHLFEQSPGPFTDKDGPFVLAFSTLMLNTDLHNPLVLKKMTVEAFVRMNKNLDGCKRLSDDIFKGIYANIKRTPLAIPLGRDGAAKAAGTGSQHDAVVLGRQWAGVLRRQGAVEAFAEGAARVAAEAGEIV